MLDSPRKASLPQLQLGSPSVATHTYNFPGKNSLRTAKKTTTLTYHLASNVSIHSIEFFFFSPVLNHWLKPNHVTPTKYKHR